MSFLVTSVHNDMFKQGKRSIVINWRSSFEKGTNHVPKVSGHLYSEYIGSNVVSPWLTGDVHNRACLHTAVFISLHADAARTLSVSFVQWC